MSCVGVRIFLFLLFATKCNLQNRKEIKENGEEVQTKHKAYVAVLPQLTLNFKD